MGYKIIQPVECLNNNEDKDLFYQQIVTQTDRNWLIAVN